MLRRLPPLNALKAFEAAARSESITRAAEELSVTQGAVSQQVKALEATLGIKLFNRERQHGSTLMLRSVMAMANGPALTLSAFVPSAFFRFAAPSLSRDATA